MKPSMQKTPNTHDQASQCPLCNREGWLAFDMPDTIYGNRFSVHACDVCRIGFTHPFPSDKLLYKIYSGDYWARESTLAKRGLLARSIQTFNAYRLGMMIRPLIRKLTTGMSVLDVGCGSGQLAVYLKRCGFKVEVNDIDAELLAEIETQHGIKGHCGDLSEIDFQRKYDAIIFNNVLEHLRAPLPIIESATRLLKTDGLIFVEVPNWESAQLQLFRARWYHLAIPQHLYHYSQAGLDGIMRRYAMKRLWSSTFSPRTSAAGYAASIRPELQPVRLRQTWSKPMILMYLMMQFLALPWVGIETLLGRGAVLRAIYQKSDRN